MWFSAGKLNRRHYYYTLNNNGITYIKDKLGITEPKVQPKTRTIRAEAVEAQMEGEEGERGGDRAGDRRSGRGGRGRGFGGGFGGGMRGRAPRQQVEAAPAAAQ